MHECTACSGLPAGCERKQGGMRARGASALRVGSGTRRAAGRRLRHGAQNRAQPQRPGQRMQGPGARRAGGGFGLGRKTEHSCWTENVVQNRCNGRYTLIRTPRARTRRRRDRPAVAAPANGAAGAGARVASARTQRPALRSVQGFPGNAEPPKIALSRAFFEKNSYIYPQETSVPSSVPWKEFAAGPMLRWRTRLWHSSRPTWR